MIFDKVRIRSCEFAGRKIRIVATAWHGAAIEEIELVVRPADARRLARDLVETLASADGGDGLWRFKDALQEAASALNREALQKSCGSHQDSSPEHAASSDGQEPI